MNSTQTNRSFSRRATTLAHSRTARRASAVLAAVGLAAVVGAGSAGAAVSALSYTPTFGCTANTLNIAEVPLNEGIGTVRVEPELDVYSNGKWVLATWGAVQSVNTNLTFSELLAPSWSFNAATNRYFEVFIWTSVNNGPWTYYPAQALRDHYTNTICHTV